MSTVRTLGVVQDPFAAELEQLFREHARLVYRTAYSVTGSAQDAEDVVQNLFLHLLRRGCPSGLRENPKGYLYRSAVNHSLNAVQSRKSRNAENDEALRDLAAPIDHKDAVQEQEQRLVAAMAELHPGAVEMLVLRYEHGFSDKEIGALLGKSRGVVAVTLYRARMRLKKILTRGNDETDK